MNIDHHSPNYKWVALGIIIVGTFMSFLDTSIINVALPHMMIELEVNRNQIEWVATGFMLVTAVSMPLVGWLVGRMGHKKLYLGSLTLFTIGSALFALAWNYDSIIVARVIQGAGIRKRFCACRFNFVDKSALMHFASGSEKSKKIRKKHYSRRLYS